ncbi:hypothetical protein M1446_03865 [Candidatus Dependentiae bacterium]|nr:hypothetical protein [Candidatus Dependentiae bacterium]
MLESTHQGIVLRKFLPKKNKVSIFDQKLGRIDALLRGKKNESRLVQGGFLTYSLEKWNNLYILQDPDFITDPFEWAKEDILFLHHILELCHYFLPIEKPSKELFELVSFIYSNSELLKSCFGKKLLLSRFFLLQSIYPNDISIYDQSFYRLISGPIDIILDRKCDLEMHNDLTRWLKECINVHPQAHLFKTVHFLLNPSYTL